MYYNNLKKLRNGRELTQEDVAIVLHRKRSSYVNWEYGTVMIPLDIADRLSLFYNVKLSYILGINSDSSDAYIINGINYDILLENLVRLKKENGHTFDDIATFLKCDKSTCNRYFNGKVIIPIDRLILLSKLYEIDLDVLCGKIKQTREKISV